MSEETVSGDIPAGTEGGIASAGEQTEEKSELQNNTKVDILLNATGNVPIMKKRKWTVEQDKPISWIIKFIHKYLKLDPEEKLFLYVNQTFAPSPDQIVKNLYECYGTNGKLVLYYCKSQAWG
ncbi:autophagy protein 12-like [Phlebotomus argentipes]|uniref:autophagy protein 12-like n=1 Tax=Phlebotomus argentipes TaxID=94469 RepID=UPI002892DDC7|nr:autophagy protein 12-like [Phlebotomus argentipes]